MSKAIFNFIVLDTRKGATQLTADQWATTLGIEVTTAPLASLCRLGNVDPQHGCGQLSYDGANLDDLGPHAACNVAAIASVYPPVGATLATVKPDCDSILGMAVTVLRHLRLANADVDGGGMDERFNFLDNGHRQWRLRLVAERDSFRPGEEWAPRPLPTTANLWPAASDMAPASETQSLAPLGVVCSPTSAQRQMQIGDRVAFAACWLLFGMQATSRDSDVIAAVLAACGVTISCAPGTPDHVAAFGWYADVYDEAWLAAHQGRAALAAAVDSGEVEVRLHRADGHHIAVVESANVGALGLGYCRAPIVVAMMPARADGHVKATIAAWRPGLVDMDGLAEDLNRAEIGGRMAAGRVDLADAVVDKSDAWGGPATVKGSPQGHGTYIALEDLVRLVASRTRYAL